MISNISSYLYLQGRVLVTDALRELSKKLHGLPIIMHLE